MAGDSYDPEVWEKELPMIQAEDVLLGRWPYSEACPEARSIVDTARAQREAEPGAEPGT